MSPALLYKLAPAAAFHGRPASLMSFLTAQGIRILQVLVASTVVLTLFFSFNHFGSENLKDKVAGHVKVPDRLSSANLPFGGGRAPEQKPANATLDFQEIIYLSMPYRTDRQDALSLIAGVTGLKLTMIPGVRRLARSPPSSYHEEHALTKPL
jgi:hypothetical protein